jgi:hypothetical protein
MKGLLKNNSKKIQNCDFEILKRRPFKKAQVEIQFNWIFVLIAGAIILIFFIGIVVKQRSASEVKLAGDVANQFEAILTASGLTGGTTNLIQIPNMEISFTCAASGDSWFGIDWKKTGYKKNLPIEVIFSPDLIKGESMITWTQEFSAPFKVANILYVTSPEIRYIFVYVPNTAMGDFAKSIYDKMPEGVFKEKIEVSEMDKGTVSSNLSNVADLNNYKVRFIFFEDYTTRDINYSLPYNFRKIDFSNLAIFPDKSLAFVPKEGHSPANQFYLDNTTLYGAIFSENAEMYECALRKLIKRLDLVTQVYAERETALGNNVPSLRFQCVNQYDGEISALKAAVENCFSDLTQCPLLGGYIEPIQVRNNWLKQKSCPLLY